MGKAKACLWAKTPEEMRQILDQRRRAQKHRNRAKYRRTRKHAGRGWE